MVNVEHWKRIKEIFQTAIELDIDKRPKYLDSTCTDPETRKEVDELIKNFQEVEEESFLSASAITKLTEEIQNDSATTITTEANCLTNQQEKTEIIPTNQKEVKDPLIGKTFANNYLIEKVIGQGGTGIVYLAQHITLNKPRAIKVLLPEVQKRLDLQTRLIREAKATQKINHKNLITTYELSMTSANQYYLVMEYIDGVNLRHKIEENKKQGKKFLPKEAFEILKPILEALEAAHSQGIVHRDVKPENILIGKDEDGNNVIKLADLGTAKFYNNSNSQTTSAAHITNVKLTGQGTLIGTPYYMSPEQWGERPKDINEADWKIDTRTDIYSVGITLYELIAGEKPFNDVNMFDLYKEHISKTATPLNQLVPNVTENFAQVVAKATAKDRSDRFQTASDFIKALAVALNLEIIQPNSNKSSTEIENNNLENPPSNSSLIGQAWLKIKELFD